MLQYKEFMRLIEAPLLELSFIQLVTFIIAASCVMYFTGADFSAAITDAIVEPLLNSVWYFVLDKYWASKYPNK